MTYNIKLALFLDQEIQTGGGFQQSLNAIEMSLRLPKDLVETTFVTDKIHNITILKHQYNIDACFIKINLFHRVRLKLRKAVSDRYFAKAVRKIFGFNYFESFIIKNGIDLVYFTTPSRYSLCLERTNFIYTVFDMCHRDHPEFPEVRDYREFESRERLYKISILRSVATIVDSKHSQANIVNRYGQDKERIVVIPFSPAQSVSKATAKDTHINIKNKYSVNHDYIFYPAQFWSHKNHNYIIRGLNILEEKYNEKISVLFCGSDKGNRSNAIELSENLSLRNRIHFTGFVPNEEIPHLYRQSLALVMPSYFGPTNIPPIEAYTLGVPVLYSDLPGQREQVKDAALLLDLNNPESLAESLYRIISDQSLRASLIEKGYNRLREIEQESESDKLIEILTAFKAKLSSWKNL